MRSLTHRLECASRPVTPGNNPGNLVRVLAMVLVLMPPLLDAAPEDGTGPAVDVGPLESSATVPDPALLGRMRERVSELQSEEGPYAAPLIEVLGDLGRLYQTVDDHEQACDVLSRALHVARVTDGLYSERQLRILGELIESERARNNWQQVDDYHHLALHIQNRLYEPGSESHLAAVRRFGDWKMQAYRRELLGQGSSRSSVPDELYTLHELYANALDATDQQQSSNDETVFALLYGRARTEYEIARQMSVMPARAFDPVESRYRTRTVCGQVNGENGELQRVCWSEQVENPRYRRAQYDERRDQVHRTVKRARQTIEEMEQLLADSSLEARQKASRRARLEKLGGRLEELEGRVGRLSIRHW